MLNLPILTLLGFGFRRDLRCFGNFGLRVWCWVVIRQVLVRLLILGSFLWLGLVFEGCWF